MERQLDVVLENPHPQMNLGAVASLGVRLHFIGEEPSRFRLGVEGIPEAWIDLGDAASPVRLEPNLPVTLAFSVRVPADATPTTLPIIVTVTAIDDPDFGATAFGAVSINLPQEQEAAPESAPSLTADEPSPGQVESVIPPAEEPAQPSTESETTEPESAPEPAPSSERITAPMPPAPPAPPPTAPLADESAFEAIGLSLQAIEEKPGSFIARIRNGGTTEVDLTLRIANERDVSAQLPAEPFHSVPGQSLDVPIEVSGSGRKADATVVPFQLDAVRPDGSVAASASGRAAASPVAGRSLPPRWMVGAVAAALLVVAGVVLWFLVLRGDESSGWPKRPVLETASSVTIQPEGDRSVIYGRKDPTDPGSSWVELADRDGQELPPIFSTLLSQSPDRKQVLFVTADDTQMSNAQFWIVPADGSKAPTKLLAIDRGFWPSPPVWSPDGQKIAYAVRDGQSLQLMIAPTGGDDPRAISPAPPDFGPDVFYGANNAPLQWVDNQSLGFFTRDAAGDRVLHQVNVDTGQTRAMPAGPLPAQLTQRTTPCMQIAFSQNDPRWQSQQMLPTGDSIGVAGCAITAIASVLVAYGDDANPGSLAACLNGQQPATSVDWESIPKCGPAGLNFSGPESFTYTKLNELIAQGTPPIVRLRSVQGDAQFVVVTSGPGGGSGLASDFGVMDPWDGSSWKTLAYFTSRGYAPDAIYSYAGPASNCTVVTGSPIQHVELTSPADGGTYRDAQTLNFAVQGAAPDDVIDTSIEDGAKVSDEGVHVATIQVRHKGEDSPYLTQQIVFTIDKTPPRSEVHIAQSPDGNGDDGKSYAGPVSVSFSAADGLSAVERIEYRVDDEQDWAPYTNDARPVPLSLGAGTHTVEFRAVDVAGNTESPQEMTFTVEGGTAATPQIAIPPTTRPAPTASVEPAASPSATVAPTATMALAPTSTLPAQVVPGTPASPTSVPVERAPSPTTSPFAEPATPLPTILAVAASPTVQASPTLQVPASPSPAVAPTATEATVVASPTATSPVPSTPIRTASPTASPTSSPAPATAISSPIVRSEVSPAVPSPRPTESQSGTPIPATQTPSPTATPTAVTTATATATSTPIPSPTVTATAIATATVTVAPTETATVAPTETATIAPTSTATVAPTSTLTPRPTATSTTSPSPTATAATATATVTPRPTSTSTPVFVPAAAPTATRTPIPTPTATASPSATPTATATRAATATRTPRPTATASPTVPPTHTPTPRPTYTPTPKPSATATPLPTATSTATATATATLAPTATATATLEPTATSTATATATATATPAPTATPTPRPTATVTPRPTATATSSPTPRPTATAIPTPIPAPSPTSTPTATATAAATATATVAPTATATPRPTLAPVLVPPTVAATPTPPGCRAAVDSDPGVKLSVKSALRKSPTDPNTLRLLIEVSNDGKKPVTAIITVCYGGTTFPPQNIPGVIRPGDVGPIVLNFEGDDPTIAYQVVASGFEISDAEIAATQPDLEIVSDDLHDPDSTHPTMWITLEIKNNSEVVTEQVKIIVVIYQGNGDIRDVINYSPLPAQLGKGNTAKAELPLAGIRSISGDYVVRVIGIAPGSVETASPTP